MCSINIRWFCRLNHYAYPTLDSIDDSPRSGFCPGRSQNVSGRLVSRPQRRPGSGRGECPVMTVPVPNHADNFPRRGSSNDRRQLAHRADLIQGECACSFRRGLSVLKGDKRRKRRRGRLFLSQPRWAGSRGIIGNQWTSSGQPLGTGSRPDDEDENSKWHYLSMMRLPTLLQRSHRGRDRVDSASGRVTMIPCLSRPEVYLKNWTIHWFDA